MGYRRYYRKGTGLTPNSFMALLYIVAFIIAIKYLEYFMVIGAVLLLLLVIYKYYNRYLIIKKYTNITIDEIDEMDGTEFELFVLNSYKNQGYKGVHNGGTGDYGGDVILRNGKDRIAVQAKCYSYAVGVKAVQEAISAREFYDCSEAIVITNNYFTKNAKILAAKCDVKLIDRDTIIKTIL